MVGNTEEVEENESSDDRAQLVGSGLQDDCEHQRTVLVSCLPEEEDHCLVCPNHSVEQWIANPERGDGELTMTFFLPWIKNICTCAACRTELADDEVFYDEVFGLFQTNIYVAVFQSVQDGLNTSYIKIHECYECDEDSPLLRDKSITGWRCVYLDSSSMMQILHSGCLYLSNHNRQCRENAHWNILDEMQSVENARPEKVVDYIQGHSAASSILEEGGHEDVKSHFIAKVGEINSSEPSIELLPESSAYLFGDNIAQGNFTARDIEDTPARLIAQKHSQLSSFAMRFISPLPTLLSAGNLNESMERFFQQTHSNLVTETLEDVEILSTSNLRLHIQSNERSLLFASKFKPLEVLNTNKKKAFSKCNAALRLRVRGQSGQESEPSDTNASTEKSSSSSDRKESAKKNETPGTSSSSRTDNHSMHAGRAPVDSGRDASSKGNTTFQSQRDLNKNWGGASKLGASTMLNSKKLGRKIQIKRITNLPSQASVGKKEQETDTKSEVYDPFNPTEEENLEVRDTVGKRETRRKYDPFEPTLSDEEKEMCVGINTKTPPVLDVTAVFMDENLETNSGGSWSSKQMSEGDLTSLQAETKENSSLNLFTSQPVDMFSLLEQQGSSEKESFCSATEHVCESPRAGVEVKIVNPDLKLAENEHGGEGDLQLPAASFARQQMEIEGTALSVELDIKLESDKTTFGQEELDLKAGSDKNTLVEKKMDTTTGSDGQKHRLKDGSKEHSSTRKRKKRKSRKDSSVTPNKSESEEGDKRYSRKHKRKHSRKERSPEYRSSHKSRGRSLVSPEHISKINSSRERSHTPRKHKSKHQNAERSRTSSKHHSIERSQTPPSLKTKHRGRARSSTPLKRKTEHSPKRKSKHDTRERSRTPMKHKTKLDSRECSRALSKNKHKNRSRDRSATPRKHRSDRKSSERSSVKSKRKRKHDIWDDSHSPPRHKNKHAGKERSPTLSKRKCKRGESQRSPIPTKSEPEIREPSDSHRVHKRKHKGKSERHSPENTEKSPRSSHENEDFGDSLLRQSCNKLLSPDRGWTRSREIFSERTEGRKEDQKREKCASSSVGDDSCHHSKYGESDGIKRRKRRKHFSENAETLIEEYESKGKDKRKVLKQDDSSLVGDNSHSKCGENEGIKKRRRSKHSLEDAKALSPSEDENVMSKAKRHTKSKKRNKGKHLSDDCAAFEPAGLSTVDIGLIKISDERTNAGLKQNDNLIISLSGSPDWSWLDAGSPVEVKSRRRSKHSNFDKKKSRKESTTEQDSDLHGDTKEKKEKRDFRKSRERKDCRKRGSPSFNCVEFIATEKSLTKTEYQRRSSGTDEELHLNDPADFENLLKSKKKPKKKSSRKTTGSSDFASSSPNKCDFSNEETLISLSTEMVGPTANDIFSRPKEPQVANLSNLVSVSLSPPENLNNDETYQLKDTSKNTTPTASSPGWKDKRISDTREIEVSFSCAEEFQEQSRKRWEERKKIPLGVTTLSNPETADLIPGLTTNSSPIFAFDSTQTQQNTLDVDDRHVLQKTKNMISLVHELQPLHGHVSRSSPETEYKNSSVSFKPPYCEKRDGTKMTENSSEIDELRLLDTVEHRLKSGDTISFSASQESLDFDTARPIETVSGIAYERRDSPSPCGEDHIFDHLMPKPGSTLIEVSTNESVPIKGTKVDDAACTSLKKDDTGENQSKMEHPRSSGDAGTNTTIVEAPTSIDEVQMDVVKDLGEKADAILLGEKAVLNPTQILNSIGLNPQQKSAAQNAILSIAELSKHLQLEKLIKAKVSQSNQESQVASPSIDSIESSAVEMHNKGKKKGLLRKIQFQEQVAEEAKNTIKPYYERREISKTEYKEILKRAVNKICSSESSMELNTVKTRRLIRRYIEKYQQKNAFKKERMKSKLSNEVPKSQRPDSPQPPKFQPLSPKRDSTEKVDYFKLAVGTPNLLKREPRKVVTLPDLPLPPPPPPPPPKRRHL